MILTSVGRLDGGHSSGGIELFDAVLDDGTSRRVLRKCTSGNEVRALTALRELDLRAVPELLDYGRDDDGSAWVLLPYYEGASPESPPLEVVETLAAVHAHFAGSAVPGVTVIDSDWWRDICVKIAAPALEAHGYADAAEIVAVSAEDNGIVRALEQLPKTLLHGDIHLQNIITGPTGTMIIDWSNARIGPQLLDIANIAEYDSELFNAYRHSWERLTDQPLHNTETGYALAAAIINTQYLPYVAQYRTPADVDAMLKARTEALRLLQPPGE